MARPLRYYAGRVRMRAVTGLGVTAGLVNINITQSLASLGIVEKMSTRESVIQCINAPRSRSGPRVVRALEWMPVVISSTSQIADVRVCVVLNISIYRRPSLRRSVFVKRPTS